MKMDRKRMRYVAPGVFLALYLLASLTAPEGPGLVAVRDLTRLALLLASIFILGRHLTTTQGRERAFWALLTAGAALWLIPQIWRVWYQVFSAGGAPDHSLSHIILFLHVIPFMAALSLRPNQRQHERTLLLDFLNTGMLLVWWIYLYAFMVMAWQTSSMPLPELSDFYFSILYFAENIVLAAGAGFLFCRSGRGWKTIYGILFLSATLYAAGALIRDRLLLDASSHSGAISDAMIVAALLLFAGVGIERAPIPASGAEDSAMSGYSVWQGRFAMLALLSMPCMALWIIFYSLAPPPVTVFRVTVTFAAIIALAVLIIVKQSMLNHDLTRLLEQKQETVTKEKHMQDHLVSSEKMAALGQLVAGAAHEINNPLTAILGYSDLLEQDASLPEESRSAVQKIGQQARRTKRLVENLLNFAQQTPAEKTSVHINALLSNAVQLREPDLAGKKIKLKVKLQPELPRIRGDSNQLLQVFLHMMNNAVDALQDVGGGTLTITTASEETWVLIQFSDTGPGIKEPQKIFDPFYTTKPVGQGTGLGLSACYGIIHDHGGEIDCQNNPNGGATFKVKLPAESAPAAN
jgi:signal transduction histidine kinase